MFNSTLKNKSFSFESYVKRARERYGDLFEYDYERFTGHSKRIWYTDKDSGVEYSQRGDTHLKNLPKELREKYNIKSNSERQRFENFYARIKNKHGSRYKVLPSSYKGFKHKCIFYDTLLDCYFEVFPSNLVVNNEYSNTSILKNFEGDLDEFI